MSQKVNIAVVGCGRIGKRHAAIIHRHPEAELVALCDVKPFEELALSDFEGKPFFENIEELLNSQIECDVVCICTPNGLHASQSILCLEAGKHVVVEKPMALTKADCEKLIHKALNVSKNVFCVMQNRYSPPSVWLKELMETGKLGTLQTVQINCYWNRDHRYYTQGSWHGTADLDGGTLFTQFSHFVDMMYWLFGDIKNIKGQFADFQHQQSTAFEDSGMVTFEFVNGGLGCINYSTAVFEQNLESSITITGSKGSVQVGGQYMNEVTYCHIENYTLPELPKTNPANDYGHYKGSAANHVYVIDNVVDVLKGRRSISVNALEAMKIVEIIERIYKVRDQQ